MWEHRLRQQAASAIVGHASFAERVSTRVDDVCVFAIIRKSAYVIESEGWSQELSLPPPDSVHYLQ